MLTGCAGAGAVRPENDPVREELRALRLENQELAARVEALSSQVDLLTARIVKGSEAARPPGGQAPAQAAGSTEGEVPADLTVIKVTPPPAQSAPRAAGRSPARPRVAPPVPVNVPIREPDPEEIEAVGRPGRRPIAAEADADLREARARTGLSRAHALEDFTSQFPQHPSADNALVEASGAYAAAGNDGAACSLARRALDEYPAGDARSDALETLAGCEERRGDSAAAQKLLDRLRADFPGTPAARRADALHLDDLARELERLRLLSGVGGGGAPPRDPARSGP